MVTSQRKRAVLYARTASREASDQSAIERQATACRRTAAALDAEVERVFADYGVSGLIAQRPALAGLIEYVHTTHVDYVICTDSNRLARSMSLAADLAKQLQAHGAQLVLANQHAAMPAAATP